MSWKPPTLKGRALALDLPLTDFAASVADRVERTSGHPKHSARSAIVHLGKAWAIRHSDPEMAVFRALTAEEEAATALIRSVQHRRYSGAGKLDPHNHLHKAAVGTFLALARRSLHEAGAFTALCPRVYVKANDPRAMPRLHLRAPRIHAAPPLDIIPDPPLHFQYYANGALHGFSQEVLRIRSEAGVRDARELLRIRANWRNRILYASQTGVPAVDPTTLDATLAEYRSKVFTLLVIFLFIAPYKLRQSFVQQSLNALLHLTGRIGEKQVSA